MHELNAHAPHSIVTSAALIALTLCITAPGITTPALAQNEDGITYPSRPIHIIVPFPAGGPTDILSRIIGREMAGVMG